MIELMVALAIMMVVSGIVMAALSQLRNSQKTINNRTAMHSGVRGATELLQQEIGQAGLIKLPGAPTLTQPVLLSEVRSCDWNIPSTGAFTKTVSSISGMFDNMVLTTLDGDQAETVKVASVSPDPSNPWITACFTREHADDTRVDARGAFATGVVPPTGIVDGSDGYHLKMYGDISGDGTSTMAYVEYICDPSDTHKLYRLVLPFDADHDDKPALSDTPVLLANLIENPPDPVDHTRVCFRYQPETVTIGPTPFTFIVNVAVTLSVETEQVDPVTKLKQTETKALLNVSPRNIVNAWSYASMLYTHRIQSTPLSVLGLLPPPGS